jgi:lysophospholipase L1-like esterase
VVRIAGVRLVRAVVQAGGLVVADGDSMTSGYLLEAGEAWPSVLGVSLGGAWSVTNHAVTGRPVQTMIDNAGTVDSQYNAANPENWVVILGGTNDIATGSSSATLMGKLQTYWSGRRAAGFLVAICTIPPCGQYDGTQESIRVATNTSIRNSLATYGDALVDFAADSRLDDAFDATYFMAGDRTHPTAAGAAVMAELVETQVAA